MSSKSYSKNGRYFSLIKIRTFEKVW